MIREIEIWMGHKQLTQALKTVKARQVDLTRRIPNRGCSSNGLAQLNKIRFYAGEQAGFELVQL